MRIQPHATQQRLPVACQANLFVTFVLPGDNHTHAQLLFWGPPP